MVGGASLLPREGTLQEARHPSLRRGEGNREGDWRVGVGDEREGAEIGRCGGWVLLASLPREPASMTKADSTPKTDQTKCLLPLSRWPYVGA